MAQFIELARTDAEIHCGLDTREATAGGRSLKSTHGSHLAVDPCLASASAHVSVVEGAANGSAFQGDPPTPGPGAFNCASGCDDRRQTGGPLGTGGDSNADHMQRKAQQKAKKNWRVNQEHHAPCPSPRRCSARRTSAFDGDREPADGRVPLHTRSVNCHIYSERGRLGIVVSHRRSLTDSRSRPGHPPGFFVGCY